MGIFAHTGKKFTDKVKHKSLRADSASWLINAKLPVSTGGAGQCDLMIDTDQRRRIDERARNVTNTLLCGGYLR